jgi:hypothetical protein
VIWYGGTSNDVIGPVGGDMPTSFELTIDFSSSTDLQDESMLSSLIVNTNTITLNPIINIKKGDIITWDSKTGLIKKNGVICLYNGQGAQTLKPGDYVFISAGGALLGNEYSLYIKYKYLYN